MTIRVLYSCEGCGLVEVGVEVPARVTEPIEEWMDKTVELLSADHRSRRPFCMAKAMQQIKIPLIGH